MISAMVERHHPARHSPGRLTSGDVLQMRIFILFLLSSVSAFAADTGFRAVSSSTTNDAGAILITDTFTRDGQTNLVRVTKIQEGSVVFRSQKFCHNGDPVAWFSFRDGSESFSTVPNSPYKVSVDFLPSKEVRCVIIFGRDFIDGFYPTNGVFYPAPDSDVKIEDVKR
jgi:hypothetical protein